MNLKQVFSLFAGFLAVFTLIALAGCSTSGRYEESRDGNYFYLNPFSYAPATSQEHLNYAVSLKERGSLSKARKQFEILVKRWPDSAEAALAKQAAAEIYFEKGANKKAFEAYKELVEQYYTDITDYDSILDRQYTIAMKEMTRRRMPWLFGGYRAPDRAIPYFESIIQNAPQWERASEMQYMIGRAYQMNDDLDLAVTAYSIVEYRYPDSSYAEKAAVAKLDSYKELVDSTPYSVVIREQAQLSAELFSEIYTNSTHLADVQDFRKELRDLSAKHTYEVGRFYERVPRPAKNKAAEIYYEKTVEQYDGTPYDEKAAERSRVLLLKEAESSTNAMGSVGEFFNQLNGNELKENSDPAGDRAQKKNESSFAPVVKKPLPERISTDEEAIEIAADRMEYVDELLIGEGNVSVQQKDASLQADRVVVDSNTGEIDARGNIVMSRGKDYWEGQSLVYNYKTRAGTFGDSFMYFEPAYITAGSTERVSTNEFIMRDAIITTCSGDDPTIYAKAKEIRVIDEQKASGVFIQAKQVTFYVRSVPVFYAPKWERHLGYRMFTFAVGASSDLGAFVMGRAELHPTEWLIANTHFDIYSRRGLGVGQDFKWSTPGGHGGIETYYINDRNPNDRKDTLAERMLADSNRYRLKLTHREQLSEETYFSSQFNWLSDPTVLRDFFNDEYRRAANPENYAVVQHSSEDYAVSLRADRRLNNFYTTVDRTPEVTFDWYRGKLGNSPFVFESENNLGYVQKQYAQTNMPWTVQPPDYDSARFDTHNQLFLPLRFDDFFNVIPRAGYRGTGYGDTVTGDAEMRNAYEFGTLTSFKAYKTLTEKSGFYGTGLRHIAEPFADYSYRDVSMQPNEVFQFDHIDALNNLNDVRFGARNFLQSRRGTARQVNVLDSEVFTTYRLDPQSGERTFSNLVAEAEMSLTDNLFVLAGLEYDWYTRDLNPANGRIQWVADDQSEYSFEYRYLAGTRSLFTPRVNLFPNEKWSYEFSVSYDEMYNEWYDRKILVKHTFDCVGMGAGLKLDQDDDVTFTVQLWLTAFPEGKFGM